MGGTSRCEICLQGIGFPSKRRKTHSFLQILHSLTSSPTNATNTLRKELSSGLQTAPPKCYGEQFHAFRLEAFLVSSFHRRFFAVPTQQKCVLFWWNIVNSWIFLCFLTRCFH